QDAAYSPDGTQIVFTSFHRGRYDIGLLSADGRDMRWLTDTDDDEYAPAWSPDGRWLAYAQYHRDTGKNALVRVRADGTGQQVLLETSGGIELPKWSQSYALAW